MYKIKYLTYKDKYLNLKFSQMNKLIGGATPLDELLKNINENNKIVFVFDVDNCLFSPPVLSIAKRKQYASEIISQNTWMA